ncbi:MAG: aldose 1-epimerase family protein [Clostridiales bacterium]|nr:aldose 1-epimerase family protein [Clostridiales bacterium]
MRFELENSLVKISVESLGAELKSVKGANGTQFLYGGCGRFWNFSSPVLFPFVGRQKNGVYFYRGQKYEMPIHGLARRCEFTLIEKTGDKLTFELKSNDETLAVYPFGFIFRIGYELVGNTVKISYSVKNTGEDKMFFGLGAHPGFLCPLFKDERFDDYFLEFSENETADIMKVTEAGLFSKETAPFLKEENKINLNFDLFKNDALVFSGLKSKSVCLKSKKNSGYIKLDFGEFKYLGIWTLAGAEFLCIEPWQTHGDYEDFEGEISEKPGILKLEAGAEYECGMSISLY